MAFTDFYVQSGGSNANAGSTNSNTPIYTTASGAWVNSTNIWTVTDAAASALTIGDWCNIGGSYVAQISNISNVSSAYTVTMSSTNFYGTSPASATYTIIDGGAWSDFTGGIFTTSGSVPVSTRVNCKYGFSSNMSGGTFNLKLKGATTLPLWLRGYNTTLGDLDNGSGSLSYPVIAIGTSGFFQPQSDNLLMSGFSFTGNVNAALVQTQNSNIAKFNHCQFVNTNTGTSVQCVSNQSSTVFTNCYFSGPSTGNLLLGENQFWAIGCYFVSSSGGSTSVGAGNGGSNSNITIIGCTFVNMGLYGIYLDGNFSNQCVIHACTFFQCGSDSIRIVQANLNAGSAVITNCMFSNSGGYDINYTASPGKPAYMYLANNDSYSPTSGHLNGFGDWVEINPLTEGSNPFVNSSASPPDLHLVNTAAGAGTGIPGLWES